jgi:hypothetical protein
MIGELRRLPKTPLHRTRHPVHRTDPAGLPLRLKLGRNRRK